MKVSALIPVYNRSRHICRAIDSVLAQTMPVDEIIVVDDGSTDDTVEVIRRCYGTSVKIIQQKNMGVSVARKRAIDEAQGEWVAFLDSDDDWLKGRNAEFLGAISKVPQNVALIFGNTRYVTDEGEGKSVFEEDGLVIKDNPQILQDPLAEIAWKLGRGHPCVLQSTFLRRSVLRELQSFKEGLRHSEDFLAGMEIASRYCFAAIPSDVTRLYRTSDLGESSLDTKWNSREDHRRAAILGYACAARATGDKHWAILHADSIRALCKWRAQRDLPIRRLAADQFTFGISARSLAFFCGAMIGPVFFKAGFSAKTKHKALFQSP
ncbi:MAG: hypothetical protein PVS2B2_17980 [Candidatus Acidiferrum sp.]